MTRMIKKTKRFLKNLKESNRLLLWEDYKQRRSVVRGFPVSVHLATDAVCNLVCPMCWQRGPAGAIKHPCIEERYLKQFARQVFPTASTLELNVSGEPLMSRLIDRELELAEEYAVRLLVTTNGTLLNTHKERFRALVRNAEEITFSFDSPQKKTYAFLRKGSDFDRVVENMCLFNRARKRLSRRNRPRFTISMVLMKRNFRDLTNMVRFVKKQGADRLVVHAMTVFTPGMKQEALDYCDDEVRRVALEARVFAQKQNIELLYPSIFLRSLFGHSLSGDPLSKNKAVASRPCGFLWLRTYLNALAQIVTCCAPCHPVMGSLKENSFEQIWNNEAYQRMRRGFKEGPLTKVCKPCVHEGIYSSLV